MIEQFYEIIGRQYKPLDEQSLHQLWSVSTIRNLKKGERLFEAGSLPRYSAFVVSGALKYFYVDEEAGERIVDLCIEQDVLCNFDNYLQKRPCDYSVEAVQHSTVICLDNHLFDKIYFVNHQLLQFGAQLAHTVMKRQSAHIHLLSMKNPVSRYRYILDQHAHLLQSFSLTELARYLNLSRETLSRARLALLNESRSICD
jgi:CRP-like cAMP-binding protein